ncbi:diacylglycerol kinase family protein [Aerococcus christensenii]
MPMDLKENKPLKAVTSSARRSFKTHSYRESIGYALEGLFFAFKQERNIRFQSVMMGFVILCAFFFGVSRVEWVILLLCCLMVLAAELANTCVEWLVDLVTDNHYSLIAKRVKDIAAGTVFLTAVFSVVIGGIIFIPYLLNWLF